MNINEFKLLLEEDMIEEDRILIKLDRMIDKLRNSSNEIQFWKTMKQIKDYIDNSVNE